MAKTSRSVFLEFNDVKFHPRKISDPTESIQRFLTQHDLAEKDRAEREVFAEVTGIETREEQDRIHQQMEKHDMPTSSYRPASLPPPRRSAEEDDDMPSFEDAFYTKKRDFRRHHRKEEQISWSRSNMELLGHRKDRRELQRDHEVKKREREQQEAELERDLKTN